MNDHTLSPDNEGAQWRAQLRGTIARKCLTSSGRAKPLQLEWLEFLLEQTFDYFLTLRFNRPVARAAMEHRLGQFGAFCDRRFLGRDWYKKPDTTRTLFFGFLERDRGTVDRFHWHVLLRLPPPIAPHWNLPRVLVDVVQASGAIAPAGDVMVQSPDDAYQLIASYSVKELDAVGESVILSSVFHGKSVKHR